MCHKNDVLQNKSTAKKAATKTYMVLQKHPEHKLASEWLLMLQVLLEFITPGARNVVYRHL